MQIQGSVCLVPGGTSGLGAATARLFSKKGVRVVIADLAAHIVENRMLNGEVIRLDGAIRFPPE
jgi:NAD(P)-dependent dehydrogenase (short-subunit alcohol dehydrogenase family)